ILPLDARAASATLGDIRDARDTALELRSQVASAIVCDTSLGALILSPESPASSSAAGYAAPIEANGSAWTFVANDSAETWVPARITSVGSARPGPCATAGPLLDATSLSAT